MGDFVTMKGRDYACGEGVRHRALSLNTYGTKVFYYVSAE